VNGTVVQIVGRLKVLVDQLARRRGPVGESLEDAVIAEPLLQHSSLRRLPAPVQSLQHDESSSVSCVVACSCHGGHENVANDLNHSSGSYFASIHCQTCVHRLRCHGRTGMMRRGVSGLACGFGAKIVFERFFGANQK
jgi:hypothetical protein